MEFVPALGASKGHPLPQKSNKCSICISRCIDEGVWMTVRSSYNVRQMERVVNFDRNYGKRQKKSLWHRYISQPAEKRE